MAEVGMFLGASEKTGQNMAFCKVCGWRATARDRYDLAAADARAHQCPDEIAHRAFVGIDPSFTNNGLVIRHLDGSLVSTSIKSPKLPPKCQDPHLWSSRIERTAAQVAAAVPEGSLVAIEGPAFGSKTGNPDERSGLRWSIIARLRQRGCRIVLVPPAKAKMWLTDSGNANKPAMLEAARELAPSDLTIRNADEADAFAILSMLSAQLGHPIFTPRPRGDEALAGVVWESLKGQNNE